MLLLGRVTSVYLIVLAVVVAVNFVITPLYHPAGTSRSPSGRRSTGSWPWGW